MDYTPEEIALRNEVIRLQIEKDLLQKTREKEYYKKWYERNKELVIKAAIEYNRKHPEKHNQAQLKWIENNKDKFLAYQRKFREDNAEKLKLYRREYYLKRKELSKVN